MSLADEAMFSGCPPPPWPEEHWAGSRQGEQSVEGKQTDMGIGLLARALQSRWHLQGRGFWLEGAESLVIYPLFLQCILDLQFLPTKTRVHSTYLQTVRQVKCSHLQKEKSFCVLPHMQNAQIKSRKKKTVYHC